MRLLITLLTAILLSACQSLAVDDHNYTFYGTAGISQYTVDSLGAALKEESGILRNPVIFIVAAAETKTALIQQQAEIILNNFNAEDYEYVYVRASTERKNEHGYHTTLTEAQRILDGTDFKILIFNRDAELVVEKDTVMPYEEVDKYLSDMQ